MATSYEEALKVFELAVQVQMKAQRDCREAKRVLLEARSQLSLECKCGHQQPVRETVCLYEIVPGYSSWDDHDYTFRMSWICSSCGEEWKDLKEGFFPEGIQEHCEYVLKWEGREPKEVSELRLRWRTAKLEKIQKEQTREAIEAAQELLKKEGLL